MIFRTFVKTKSDMLSSIFLFVGPWQIVLIVLVILLLFGGRKIPELMKGLGRGIKEFKDASKEDYSDPDRPEDKK